MRWTAIPLSLVVFGLLYLFFRPEPSEPQPSTATPTPETNPVPDTPTDPLVIDATPAVVTETAPTVIDTQVVRHCVGDIEPEEIPEIAADIDRLEPYLTNHASLENYRGLSEADALGLAQQGDSVAMTLLGARYFDQAVGRDGDPVDSLRNPDPFRGGGPGDDERRALLEQAAYWFMEAALNGRYSSLADAGYMYELSGVSAVDLGWVSAEEYATFDRAEQLAWRPYTVYRDAANAMMADAWTGPAGELAEAKGFFNRDAHSEIVDQLLNSFLNDMQARGLHVQTVEPWEGRSLPEILNDICPDIVGAP